jgi:hypothetical protein
VPPSVESPAPDSGPGDPPDSGPRARLRRVLHGLRSFFRGREGAEQEGLLAERTLLISRSARREERSRPESPGAGADERD